MASKKEKNKVVIQAAEFINFYKAGFIDGYNSAVGKTDWKKIFKKCRKAFEKRFKVIK